MKKILIVCVLLTSAVCFSYAQVDGGTETRGGGFPGGQGQGRGGQQGQGAVARTPEARAQTYLETLMESFTFNKEVRAQILAVLLAENKSLDSLTATVMPPQAAPGAAPAAPVDPAAMLAQRQAMQAANLALQPKRMAIMQASEAKFIALLSDKQKKLYESSIKDRPATQGFGQAGRGGGAGGQGAEGGRRGQGGGGGGGFGGGGQGGGGGGGGF